MPYIGTTDRGRLDFGKRVAGEKAQKADEFITKSQLIAGLGISLDNHTNNDIEINSTVTGTLPQGKNDQYLIYNGDTEQWEGSELLAGDNITLTRIRENDIDKVTISASGGGGGLQYFEESRNNVAPNVTIPAHKFTPIGTETDIDFVISPKGNGAILRNVPDNNTAGNKRGWGAIDFQHLRHWNSDVASGAESLIMQGEFNKASGVCSTVVNGAENYATAEMASILGGTTNIASGDHSTILNGYLNLASSKYGQVNSSHKANAYLRNQHVHADGSFSGITGSAQKSELMLMMTGSGEMFLGGVSPNRLVIPANTVWNVIITGICGKINEPNIHGIIGHDSTKITFVRPAVGDVQLFINAVPRITNYSILSSVTTGFSYDDIYIIADTTNNALKFVVDSPIAGGYNTVVRVELIECGCF